MQGVLGPGAESMKTSKRDELRLALESLLESNTAEADHLSRLAWLLNHFEEQLKQLLVFAEHDPASMASMRMSEPFLKVLVAAEFVGNELESSSWFAQETWGSFWTFIEDVRRARDKVSLQELPRVYELVHRRLSVLWETDVSAVALHTFGGVLISQVRDAAIRQWRQIVRGGMKATEFEATKLTELQEEGKAAFLSLVPRVVDTVLHHLLWTLEQPDDIAIAVQVGVDRVESLKEVSGGGLAGELYTEEGWIARFSEYEAR
jgi:hypothetical protein